MDTQKRLSYVNLSKPMRTSFVVDFGLRFLEYKLKHQADKNKKFEK